MAENMSDIAYNFLYHDCNILTNQIQSGLQNLNIEGMHMVRNRSHTYFTNDWHLLWHNIPSKMQLLWGA